MIFYETIVNFSSTNYVSDFIINFVNIIIIVIIIFTTTITTTTIIII